MMAKVELKLPTNFEERLSRLADKTDEIIPKVLEAGGEVVLAKVKSNLASVVGRGTKDESRSTGELERSLGLSPSTDSFPHTLHDVQQQPAVRIHSFNFIFDIFFLR